MSDNNKDQCSSQSSLSVLNFVKILARTDGHVGGGGGAFYWKRIKTQIALFRSVLTEVWHPQHRAAVRSFRTEDLQTVRAGRLTRFHGPLDAYTSNKLL